MFIRAQPFLAMETAGNRLSALLMLMPSPPLGPTAIPAGPQSNSSLDVCRRDSVDLSTGGTLSTGRERALGKTSKMNAEGLSWTELKWFHLRRSMEET